MLMYMLFSISRHSPTDRLADALLRRRLIVAELGTTIRQPATVVFKNVATYLDLHA